MVAERKKPQAPAAIARSSSSLSTPQPPRPVKSKAPHATQELSVNRDRVSGKHTRQPKAPKPKPSLLDRLFLPSLLLLFLYTALICPTDTAQTHRVCRAITTYRQVILEPYVLPPLRAVVTHPVVVEPYKSHVEPVLEKVVTASAPAIAVARKAAPVVVKAYEGGKSVYIGTLVPWWHRAVVPRYHLHIAPHVERHLVPVYLSLEQYISTLHPHIRALQARMHHLQQSAEPYVTKGTVAVTEAYNTVQPYIHKAYTITRPHALALWARAKPLLCAAWRQTKVQSRVVFHTLGVQLRLLAVELGNARRRYVDPHILRIWEKVSESSPFPPSEAGEVKPTAESTLEPTPTTSLEAPSPIPSDDEVKVTLVEDTPAPAEGANEEFATPSATPVDTEEEEKGRAVSVAEESAGYASAVVADIISEVADVTPTPAPSSTLTPTPTPEVISEEKEDPKVEELRSATSILASSASGASILIDDTVLPTAAAAAAAVDEEDIDDFLRDLGLDSSPSSTEAELEPTTSSPPPPELTQEEKDAQTAQKRADIVGRHMRWRAELASLAKEKERAVKRNIEAVRTSAVVELKEMSEGLRDNTGKLASKKEGRKGVVDGVQAEGEKLLRGVEAYLSKASARSGAWKRVPGEHEGKAEKDAKREEENAKWGRVVEKVEEKFGDIVRGTQGEVNVWYRGVREREIGEVLEAAQEVKLLAERAQADIGLDYAWLEDVTYQDWQKYHDLMRTSDQFDQTARSLQNSTHPSAPADPLLPALNALEREMQDVVAGFNVRISELASEARGVFSPFVDGDDDDTTYNTADVPKDEVSPEELKEGVVLGKKEVVGVLDLNEEEREEVLEIGGAPVVVEIGGVPAVAEPEVSILPVDGNGESENEDVLDASKIVIGKSKEEIEGALGGVSRDEL